MRRYDGEELAVKNTQRLQRAVRHPERERTPCAPAGSPTDRPVGPPGSDRQRGGEATRLRLLSRAFEGGAEFEAKSRYRLFLEGVEELVVDDVRDSLLEAEFQLLEHVQKLVPSTSSMGGTPSRTASRRASAVNVPVVRMMPLSARPAMAPRKSRTCAGVTEPTYRLH